MKQEQTFTLTIAKVDETLFSGEAVSVTLPGLEGQLTILAHHEPLIGLLKQGVIIVRTSTESLEFTIDKGLLETSGGQVTILL